MTRLSCCCDWGSDVLYPRGVNVWYIAQTSDGGTDRLLKVNRNTGAAIETSAFTNADLIACVSEISGALSFYAVTASGSGLSNKILKYDFNGTLAWTYDATGMTTSTATSYNPKDRISVDASGNTYICGFEPTSDTKLRVDKVDPDSNQIWSSTVTPPSGRDYVAVVMAVDASGNIVAVGGDGLALLLSYFNSAGTEQWTLDSDDGLPSVTPHKVIFDASGNFYIVTDQSGAGNIQFLSYDNTGTLRFSKLVGYITSITTPRIDIEFFNGRLYTAHIDAGTKDIIISRRSDSTLSTLDWEIAIPYTEFTFIVRPRISVDANGDVYCAYATFTSPNSFGYYTKRNGSDGSEVFLETTIRNTQTLVPPGKPPIFI